MIDVFSKGNRNFIAIFAAFFTAGLVESFLPLLNFQISYTFPDEYYIRVLTFTGLLALSLLSVLFSLIKTAADKRIKMMIALILILGGLLFMYINMKSVNAVLLSVLLLFSGSLFVQIAGLQFLISSFDKGKIVVRITLLYLIKSAGLAAGSGVPLILSSSLHAGTNTLIFFSLFFVLFSMACLIIGPLKITAEKPSEIKIIVTARHLISDKYVLLIAGGLVVYAGAEFCLVNLLPFYFSESFGIKILKMIIPGVGLFTVFFILGRLAGVMILRKINPAIVFLISSFLCILGLFSIFIGQKYLSLGGTMMIGLGASNIFPIMISLAVNRIREGRNVLIGMMIAAVPVGALFPSLMWAVKDSVSIAISFSVPFFCMFCITWIAIMLIRRDYVRG